MIQKLVWVGSLSEIYHTIHQLFWLMPNWVRKMTCKMAHFYPHGQRHGRVSPVALKGLQVKLLHGLAYGLAHGHVRLL
ncbi:hypothetical protein V6Z11_D02G199000 [Gossypium hirsutum]